MGHPYDKDWCLATWQILFYLETVYDRLESQEALKVENVNWGADKGEGEEHPDAIISFQVKPKSTKRTKGYYLLFALWFKSDGLEGERPIWIEVIRNDPQLWKRLKGEFREGLLHEDDWELGLEWPLSDRPSNNDLQQAGEELADRITKVLTLDD